MTAATLSLSFTKAQASSQYYFIVLDRYLNSGSRTPDKVLVSQSTGKLPFRLSAMPVRIGGKRMPVLHIMTNSYPAAKLAINYRVRLDLIKSGELADGRTQTIRQAITEQQGEAIIDNVIQEISRALNMGGPNHFFRTRQSLFKIGSNRINQL